ncbi:MAG: DUF6754 domain-containing protein [bacterium]
MKVLSKDTTHLLQHSWLVALIALLGLLPAWSPPALAQEIDAAAVSAVPDSTLAQVAPPTSVVARDFKYDNGEALDLSWVPSIDDQLQDSPVMGYKVYRIADGSEPQEIASLPPRANSFHDDGVELGHEYRYYVATVGGQAEYPSVITAPLSPQWEMVNLNLGYLFLMALIIGGAVLFYIIWAQTGKTLFVRRIAGLEAVDDAIGRATEMGRPILFIPGIHDMDDVQTLAAITILGRVAQQVADYDTKIRMPVSRSLVMTAARETIKAAYQTAGRPDAYSDDMVNYVTDEQFGYVAAVDGIMVREKPATCFLLGAFFAESLILAETGNSIGAIQIAGTARPAQLPFFIAACDFTLIGEELFAASAYLSGEPKQLGSLKGQDVGKAIAMIAIVAGVISLTIGQTWNVEFFNHITRALLKLLSVN